MKLETTQKSKGRLVKKLAPMVGYYTTTQEDFIDMKKIKIYFVVSMVTTVDNAAWHI